MTVWCRSHSSLFTRPNIETWCKVKSLNSLWFVSSLYVSHVTKDVFLHLFTHSLSVRRMTANKTANSCFTAAPIWLLHIKTPTVPVCDFCARMCALRAAKRAWHWYVQVKKKQEEKEQVGRTCRGVSKKKENVCCYYKLNDFFSSDTSDLILLLN